MLDGLAVFDRRMSAMATKAEKRYRRTFIRQWRKRRGLTQEQLAEMIDLVPSQVSMLEQGKRGYTQETIEAIAEALKTDVGSLLTREPDEGADLWAAWNQALPSERETIAEIAQTIVKRR